MGEETKIVTLAELDNIAKGEIVKISGWKSGTFIYVRLKPVDMTEEMLKLEHGLPNPLKKEVQEVFEGKKDKKDITPKMADSITSNEAMAKQLKFAAKLALVQPTYDEITSRIPLLANQKLEIFAWVMGGIEGLRSFRGESKQNGGVGSDSSKFLNKTQ